MSGAALSPDTIVGVIGAGTMGAGIAQVAAAAGHPVRLFDVSDGAAARGKAQLAKGLDGLVGKGRMAQEDADALIGRIAIIDTVDALAGAGLVIEAIVENLEVKRDLVTKLEAVLAPDALIGTNTSSISITAIARDAAHPERIAGLHFFNPAPVMKLVEIVSGVATAPAVADTLFATAKAWGKVPVHAKSTPGFIVNRVARAYYAEPLRLYEEQLASPATLDALTTEGGGFRMGPFTLMDLIGHDVNYAVSRSVFEAYYHEPRFRPSIAQLELVDAGRLGRKSGRGFYDYAPGAVNEAVDAVVPSDAAAIPDLVPDGRSMKVDGVTIDRTDGRTAGERSIADKYPVLLYDLIAADGATRIAFTASSDVPDALIARFVATLSGQGLVATRLADWPGLVVMRTVALLANEAFEAVLQGVASEADVDAAMRFGVNYPKGPIAWARDTGMAEVLATIDHLHALTGDPRYRASLALRNAAGAA